MDMLLGFPFTPSITNIKQKQCGVVEVSWNPSSADSGGGPITSFHAQIRKENSSKWHNCTDFLSNVNHNCSFDGLLSSKNFNVRVRAVNQKGSSDWTNGTYKTERVGR